MNFAHFQGKLFNIIVIQVYTPTTKAKEAEVEWFYEDLQGVLELTPKEDVLFIIRDWNAKAGSQEKPGVTDKFGLGHSSLCPHKWKQCNSTLKMCVLS